MGILFILLAIGGILLSAITFEAIYNTMRTGNSTPTSKPLAARVWWCFAGIVSIALAPTSGVIQLPILLVIGLSHISMCYGKDEVITVTEILQNIPATLRDVFARLRSYL
jgi:hypothetical protein